MRSQYKPLIPVILFALCAFVIPTLSAPATPPRPSPEWQALEATGSVVTFENLDRDGITLLLSSAQRLVADPAAGKAVAVVLPAQMPRLAGLAVTGSLEGACEALFLSEAYRVFPDQKAESSAPPKYLRKTPVSKTLPPGTHSVQATRRPGSRPEVSCLFEGFEETPIWWEDWGSWYHFEAGLDNNEGDYFWLDEDCTAATGEWSASATFGGDYGQYLNCFDNYDTFTDSWMMYAYWIECAAGRQSATLSFAMTLKSERDYDTLSYLVSVDDTDYYGYFYSGDFSQTWYSVTQDLRSFYGIGDLTAYSGFALAFNFYADDRNQFGWGAFVDDIAINYDQIWLDQVTVARNPFRLKVWGGSFAPGAWVYIDGVAVPVVKYKDSTLVVAKGGAALKSLVRVGRDVCVQVMNPNGNTTGCYYFRY